MELIDELESSKRHLYGGAVCKIDSDGNLDSCIVIRSGVVQNGVVRVRAGAGIVFDSDPATEALETRNKAKGVFKSVISAEAGVL
jgi:anthranilate synthase component 1